MSLPRRLLEIICALLARWGLWYCRRRDLATPVITVNGALVRPNEILVDIEYEDRIADRLRELGGRPYVPSRKPDGRADAPSRDEEDWRQDPLAPDYGDVNAQLDEAGLRCHLWVGFSTRRAVRLVRKRELPGVHFNSVYLDAIENGYYQGGPDRWARPWPTPGTIPAHTGDSTVEVAVLDTGMPASWQTNYLPLANTVVEATVGATVDSDPLGDSGNNKIATHGAHGLFICGLIARLHSVLDIQSHRVMTTTGEVDDTKACPAITQSAGAVVSLSFSGHTPNNVISFAMGNAVNDAVGQKDQVLVAAAGNGGGSAPGAIYRPSWPAAHPKVIAVGAFDSTNSSGLPTWTNHADVYAPGVNLLSVHAKGWTIPMTTPTQTYQGSAKWSGTSFATPVVAAEIATTIAGGIGSRQQAATTWLTGLKDSIWPGKYPSAPNGKRLDPKTDLTG